MKTVTVHKFKLWDISVGDYVVQSMKSTAERIKEMGGDIVPGTAEEVDPAELDEQGQYHPEKGSNV